MGGMVCGKINTGLPGAITTVAPDEWPTMTDHQGKAPGTLYSPAQSRLGGMTGIALVELRAGRRLRRQPARRAAPCSRQVPGGTRGPIKFGGR